MVEASGPVQLQRPPTTTGDFAAAEAGWLSAPAAKVKAGARAIALRMRPPESAFRTADVFIPLPPRQLPFGIHQDVNTTRAKWGKRGCSDCGAPGIPAATSPPCGPS